MNEQYKDINNKLVWVMVAITLLIILIVANITIQAHYVNKQNTDNIIDCFVPDYNMQIEHAELWAGSSYCIIAPDSDFDF